MSTELHLALQRHYAGDTGLVEAELAGYRADVLRDGVVYEVQTGSFSAIRKKLTDLSQTRRVVLVFPVPARKFIVRLDPESGEELSSRRSPKRGSVLEVFEELLYVADLLQHQNLSLHVVMTVERELRRHDGKGPWHRKGVSLAGRELMAIVAVHRFDQPRDFLRLLPPELPQRFTVADLQQATDTKYWMAGRMAYGLRQLGAIEHVGKKGNAFLYQRADD